MEEKPVATARASVMMFDTASNNWIASGNSQGISKVQLFKHQINNTYRVVGWKLADKEVVLNCAIYRGLKYNQARPTFHQWRDTKHQVYGLNFTNKDEAEQFANAIIEALENLNIIYRQSQQLALQQQQQQQHHQMDNQNTAYYSQQQQPQQPQPSTMYQSQLSSNSNAIPEYAMPQKTSQSLATQPQDGYKYATSNGGVPTQTTVDMHSQSSTTITTTVAAAPPPPGPPPPGPPPPMAAPPPPPGPPPITASISSAIPRAPQPPQPLQTQDDSDDDSGSNAGGFASQLRQAKLKSAANKTSASLTTTAAVSEPTPAAASSTTLGRAGGDSMMSEMQRVLAARKKAKETGNTNASSSIKTDASESLIEGSNGASGDNSANKWKQNHQRSPSDCDSTNGAQSRASNSNIEQGKSGFMQCATLGRKGSLQPDGIQMITRQDLDIFKREILLEVRQMIQQFKSDIVDAIKTQRP